MTGWGCRSCPWEDPRDRYKLSLAGIEFPTLNIPRNLAVGRVHMCPGRIRYLFFLSTVAAPYLWFQLCTVNRGLEADDLPSGVWSDGSPTRRHRARVTHLTTSRHVGLSWSPVTRAVRTAQEERPRSCNFCYSVWLCLSPLLLSYCV